MTKAAISIDDLIRRANWVMRRNEKLLLAEGHTAPDYYFGRGEGDLLYHLRFDKIAWMMNDGPLKEGLFSMVRYGVELNGYDCVVFCCDMWAASIPAKNRSKPFPKEKSVEALGIVAQTPRDAYMHMRSYRRDQIQSDHVFALADLSRNSMAIEQYSGRTKMFGDWGEPGMQQAYRKVKRFYQRGDRALGIREVCGPWHRSGQHCNGGAVTEKLCHCGQAAALQRSGDSARRRNPHRAVGRDHHGHHAL